MNSVVIMVDKLSHLVANAGAEILLGFELVLIIGVTHKKSTLVNNFGVVHKT